uniref:Twitchin isoform x4 n=1 Tax=Triatoma infestans TaxID=30076 RepID=A0A170XZ39_TRIIF
MWPLEQILGQVG